MSTIVYQIDQKLYINLTNRCSNRCVFCVRNIKKEYENYSLWLSAEPTTNQVITELNEKLSKDIEQVVFCGYGEPLYRLDAIVEIATYLKEKGVKTRLNTNGQASLIVGDGVAKRLVGLIDKVNISLNATTAEKYQEICNSKFGAEAFFSLLSFADQLVFEGIAVTFSVVDTIGKEEIEKAQEIAKEHGAVLRVRTYIEK